MISPKEISENPSDPLRIGLILYELRGLWIENPNLTLGQLLRRVIENEYNKEYFYTMTDDELVAAIQNYGEMGNI